ncbi:chemotaxis protein CheY [Neosynechococcus sphagnicola sy1]|uniref:Chemotaxis protein CheY n=1 Tax=Neosynechococcus sphagnicola sy1 TaxID=1497020 RepID=A0A098TKW5_9CYAN|nr:response regulator [Neosynechococcus sphagnicola]KGF72970.1 chemotaxis protein CheY [Neosynechococcus sphagnicola sy1]
MSTVLIVDDSSTIREMVLDLLIKHGLTVVQASDGVEAKEKIQASCPDIVVTDIIMPNMNGYELCRWLKNEPKTKDIPVIMFTTKSEEFDRYWGLKQGGDAYITKPYQPEELLETIHKLLKK